MAPPRAGILTAPKIRKITKRMIASWERSGRVMEGRPRRRGYHGGSFRRKDRPLVYAHRGSSLERPENSCAAFELAAAQGADGIECDVRRCASGELVVCHDETLERLAGVPVAVRDLPLAALQRLEILEDRFPGVGARIPTLAEAIEAGGEALIWNLELKVDRHVEAEPLAHQAVKEIARLRLADRVLVSSFHPQALLSLRVAAPTIPTAWLWERKAGLGRVWDDLWGRLCASAALHPQAEAVTAAQVERWHDRGMAVNPWTVDDPEELDRLRACGVDGVITNVPALALARFT